MKHIKSCTAAVAVLCFLAAGASAVMTFLEQTWFGITQTTTGGCGVSYTECPDKVLCNTVPPPANRNSTPITNAPFPCDDYTGGVGIWPNCTGGTLQPSHPTMVTIWQQTCIDPCP